MSLNPGPVKSFTKPLLWLSCMLLILVVWALWRQEPGYLFRIEGLKFGPRMQSVTVGADDPIIIENKRLDTGFFTVTRQNDSLRWSVRRPFYIKINNENVNKHELTPGSIVHFFGRTLTFQQIKDSVDKYPNQSYYDLHDIAGAPVVAGNTQNAGFHSLVYCARPGKLKSIISNTKYFIIILERNVWLQSGAQQFRTVTERTETGRDLSVEFIIVDTATFISDEKPLFRNKDINIPTLRTEWQSSRLTFRLHPDQIISAYYSQPLSIMISKQDINDIRRGANSRTVHLCQEGSIYDKRNFHFEKFSSAYPLPLAGILLEDSANATLPVIRFARNPGNNNNTVTVDPLPLAADKDFNVQAPRQDVSLIGKQYKINGIDLAIPFITLLLIAAFAGIFTWYLTDARNHRSFYAAWLAANKAEIDADRIKVDESINNHAFWNFRLPVLLFVFCMLCIKLIIAVRLGFTYPFFPHLYFTACTMAFTTPVFIAYWWIRNSWWLPGANARVRKLPGILILGTGFVLAVAACLGLAWMVAGEMFYSNYFAAYSYHVSIYSLLDVFTSSNPIFEEKLFQIPAVIALLAILIPAADIFFTVVLKRLGFERLRQWGRNKIILGFVIENSTLFIIGIGLMIFRAFYVPVHFLSIVFVFLLVCWLARKWPLSWGKSPFAKVVILAVIALACAGYPLTKGDAGFFINYPLVLMFLLLLTGFMIFQRPFQNQQRKAWIWLTPLLAFLFFIGFILAYSRLTPPTLSDVSRTNRRIVSLADPDKALATGGRLYLSDLQFFQIMKVNAMESFKHPAFTFINRNKPIHGQISRGVNPVAINDLNPLQLIDFGGWLILTVLFSLWIVFFIGRLRLFTAEFDIKGGGWFSARLNFTQLVRWIPVLIILGNSVWMMLSIFGLTVFTGRVINGWGVDSFVDWFELICLSAFMGYVMIYTKKDLDKT